MSEMRTAVRGHWSHRTSCITMPKYEADPRIPRRIRLQSEEAYSHRSTVYKSHEDEIRSKGLL